jgi:ketosteroid isomerase-like protein
MKSNLQLAKDYLSALEKGVDRDTLAAFFSADVVQEEFPNRLSDAGARRELQDILDGNERGRALMQAQRYELRNAIASGDTVVLEVLWTGTLAQAVNTLAAGDRMRAHFAVFLEFRGGRIVKQRNYDCFLPF